MSNMNRKLVVVKDRGVLRELNNIAGPIVSPSAVTIDAIQKLLIHGRTVFECDPAAPRDESRRIQLTLENFKKDNFPKKVEAATAYGEMKNPPVEEPKASPEPLKTEEPTKTENPVQITDPVVGGDLGSAEDQTSQISAPEVSNNVETTEETPDTSTENSSDGDTSVERSEEESKTSNKKRKRK